MIISVPIPWEQASSWKRSALKLTTLCPPQHSQKLTGSSGCRGALDSAGGTFLRKGYLWRGRVGGTIWRASCIKLQYWRHLDQCRERKTDSRNRRGSPKPPPCMQRKLRQRSHCGSLEKGRDIPCMFLENLVTVTERKDRITLQPTQASIADGIKTLNTLEILEGEHKKSLE